MDMKHDALVLLGEKWLRKKGCWLVCTELMSYAGHIPDVIGFNANYSHMLEVKVSRSDFFRDRKKRHINNTVGYYRHYLVPAGMVTADECPPGWGLLYARGPQVTDILDVTKDRLEDREGQSTVCYLNPKHNIRCEYQILLSVLRRHKIRHAHPAAKTIREGLV